MFNLNTVKNLRYDLDFQKQQIEQLRLENDVLKREILREKGLSEYKVYVESYITHIVTAKTIRNTENVTVFSDENDVLVACFNSPIVIEKIR